MKKIFILLFLFNSLSTSAMMKHVKQLRPFMIKRNTKILKHTQMEFDRHRITVLLNLGDTEGAKKIIAQYLFENKTRYSSERCD